MKPAVVGFVALAFGAVATVVLTGLLDGSRPSPGGGDGATTSCPALDQPGVAGAGPAVVPDASGDVPAAYTVEVVDRLPHDDSAFTQGLLHADGWLYEGTGGYGASLIRLVEPTRGDAVIEQALPASMFGEGVAGHDGRLYQLTWREEEVLVRDRCTLLEQQRMSYDGEGWGLTGDGAVLWRSDGTSMLSAHDPDGFDAMRKVQVLDRGTPVERLNELELVDGQILANVWQTPWITRIDPTSGQVTGWIDASALVVEVGSRDPAAVLNGIAVDPASGRLWLTGKRWPTLFEVRIVPGTSLPAPGGLG